MPDVQIAYHTLVEQSRTGIVGVLLRWMGDHPLVAGLLGGLAAVAIAAARSFDGVRAAPIDALIISAIVVAVWVVIFYFLRGFFARQAVRQVQVRRDIEATSGEFRWLQDEAEELRRIEEPVYSLYSTEVPEHVLDEGRLDDPWPVWLVVTGDGGRFVLETKITVKEANEYAPVAQDVVEDVDEEMSTGMATELLSCADRAV